MAIDDLFHDITVYGYRGLKLDQALSRFRRGYSRQIKPNISVISLGFEDNEHQGIRAVSAISHGSNALWQSSDAAILLSTSLEAPVHFEFAGKRFIANKGTTAEDIDHDYFVQCGRPIWERSQHALQRCLAG